MNRNETIVITSAVGVALLAFGYIHRELLVRNLRKLKARLLARYSSVD